MVDKFQKPNNCVSQNNQQELVALGSKEGRGGKVKTINLCK
jgi:hypothetical protein